MTRLEDRLGAEDSVRGARAALAGRSEDVWMVGGSLRDTLLGRRVADLDLAVDGDPAAVACAVARAAGGPAFPLSEAFGAWRALDGARRWICDVSPLQGPDIEADLGRRDFTVNAMAVPLAGGELLDPHGGARDLEARTLRVLGPQTYAEDPLRPLRLARLATELGLTPDLDTERLTREAAPRVTEASPERIWAELRRLVSAPAVIDGLALSSRLGLTAAVLPELDGLRGVEQSHFHHLDVHGHTLEVLSQMLALEEDPEAVFGPLARPLAEILDEPLGDDLTRREGLRFAALLHDIAKPATRAVLPAGRVAFPGHDTVGDEVVSSIFRRLRAGERLRAFVAGITRHHLRLGFLVHDRPLSRRAIYAYLSVCEPVEVEVTVLSCADRLATRGRNAEKAIVAHLELARELLEEGLRWRREGPPRAPVRGDDLARALGLEPGPELGALLGRLREARFAGEVESPEEAVELARRLRENAPR